MTQLKPKTVLENNTHTARDVAAARGKLLALMSKVTPSSAAPKSVIAKKTLWV